MKKRYLLFVLCAFFTVFGLASCNTDKKDPDKTDQVTEYTVTFQVNGGSVVQSKTVKEGQKVTKPTDPTKEGYDFKGWYKDSACTNEWKFDTDTVTGNITLYAKWEAKSVTPPADKYSITYVSEHGTTPEKVNEATALPATLPTVADVEGWHFEGWYTKNTYEESSKAVGGTQLTGNITLYAKWTDLSKKTITGVTFTSKTVVYDGTEHSILVAGTLPSGVTASYSNNKATNAGVYTASVTLSGDEYNPLILTATLTISKATFSGLSFEDATYTFDNTVHSLSVSGTPPANTMVSYSCTESSTISNSAIHAGTYHIRATITNPNYTTATYDAVLTINKATLADDGISFSNETFSYDGTPHTIEIVGQLPEGSVVTYTCAENNAITNSATETGTYTITATITHQDYTTKQFTATLKITASDDERHITYFNGKLYFANALDKDKFYSYDSSNGIVKVSSDIPYNFTVVNESLYFRSYSIFASSIKTLSTRVETIASEKGEYLCTDGTYLYYAVNGLTQNKSGIYRINPLASEPTPILISSGKAKYLQYKSGCLYFADGMNGWKLSRVSTSGGNRSLVVDEKINCLTIEGNYLFFTVNNLMGDYIANYNLSTNTLCKLTIDAGSNLTVIGNDLYYLNVDLVTSSIFGKGIYKVNAYPTGDRQFPGTKVIGEENENYSSLTLVDNQIAYYKVSTQMLCLYNINTETETELLNGFTAPEVTPLSTGSKTEAYKDRLYYLDLYNDKALYQVNTITNKRNRITSNKVSDFAIIGDTLYFNQVSYGVNNDLYKVDLVKGGSPELISKNDCVDIVSDGMNLYYVEQNVAGARTAIHKLDSAGSDTMIYSKGVDNLTYYKGYLYFIDGKDMFRISVTDSANTAVKIKDGNTSTFVIYNDTIYFREMHGIAWAFKNLSKMNLDGSNETVVCGTDTDPIHLVVSGDKLYYYSDITKDNGSGIYCLDLTNPSATPELILARKTASMTYYASDFTVLNGNIYFVNYYNTLGDSHLYKVNIESKSIERMDN